MSGDIFYILFLFSVKEEIKETRGYSLSDPGLYPQMTRPNDAAGISSGKEGTRLHLKEMETIPLKGILKH